MKIFIFLLTLPFLGGCSVNQTQAENETQKAEAKSISSQSLYDQSINAIDSEPMNLKEFKGSPVLFVNIATQCGYTKQLSGLEKVYQQYKDKGLKVVGIPSNDFGGQTPEEAPKVKDFCKLNYGVTFPLTEKTKITKAEDGSLAEWLVSSSDNKEPVKWNFEKFLVSKDGKLIKRYKSAVTPESDTLINDIKAVL